MIYDVLANRNEWWVPGKIADIRAKLVWVWRKPEARAEPGEENPPPTTIAPPTPPVVSPLHPQRTNPRNFRSRLSRRAPSPTRQGASRDVGLLDIALDKHFRLCVERTDKSALTGDNLVDLVELVLRNGNIAGEWPELEAARAGNQSRLITADLISAKTEHTSLLRIESNRPSALMLLF